MSEGAAVGAGVGWTAGGTVSEELPDPQSHAHHPGTGVGANVVDDQNFTVIVHPTRVVLG